MDEDRGKLSRWRLAWILAGRDKEIAESVLREIKLLCNYARLKRARRARRRLKMIVAWWCSWQVFFASGWDIRAAFKLCVRSLSLIGL